AFHVKRPPRPTALLSHGRPRSGGTGCLRVCGQSHGDGKTVGLGEALPVPLVPAETDRLPQSPNRRKTGNGTHAQPRRTVVLTGTIGHADVQGPCPSQSTFRLRSADLRR